MRLFQTLFVMAVSACLAMAVSNKDQPDPRDKLEQVEGGAKDEEDRLVDWYDCSQRIDGNYVHPNDCTKFMSCVAHAYAYERHCAACHENPANCPTGRLHYHHPEDRCEWADVAGCVVEPGPGPGPEPGPEDCDPDDCQVTGWCHDYWWCEREESDHKGTGKRGVNRTDTCPEEFNLYFNPNRNDVHGGVCDFWENLDPETKHAYNSDPNCIDPHCEWKPDPDNECSSRYFYFHPDKNDGQDVELHCPARPDGEQLVWDQSRKSCHVCSAVLRSDGITNCC